MSCATDEVLAAWFAGRVGGAERDALEAHASSCSLCRGVMLALAGVSRTNPTRNTIGRFEITEAGDHLRGHDPVSGRDAVIRIVRGEHAVRDVGVFAKLTEKTLVRALQVGELDSDAFLATEIVDGTPLADWLTRPRTIPARVRVLVDAGRALNQMHRYSLAHGAVDAKTILVRRDGSGVLTAPLLTGIAKDDQRDWWNVVATAMGPKRSLERALRRGRAENPAKRFRTMNAAVTALSRRDRFTWIGIGLLVFAVLVAIGAFSNESRKLKASDGCAVATREWRAMRIPLIAKLGAAGVDIKPVIASIDDRVLRTNTLERAACISSTASCVADNWHDFKQLYPALIDRDPSVTRAAVDELALLAQPEHCRPNRNPPATDELHAKIQRIVFDGSISTEKAVADLRALTSEVNAMASDVLTGQFHAAIGHVLTQDGETELAAPELQLAINYAVRGHDDETELRALTDAIGNGAKPNAPSEQHADELARKLGNAGLDGELAVAKALARSVDGGMLDEEVELFRTAQQQLAGVSPTANAHLLTADWMLAGVFEAKGDYKAAQLEWDAAYALAGRRWGDHASLALFIREQRAKNLWSREKYKEARSELVAVSQLQEGAEQAVTLGDLCELDLQRTVPTTSCDDALAAAEIVYRPGIERVASLRNVGRERLNEHRPAEAIPPLELALSYAHDDLETQQALAIALSRSHRDPARERALSAAVRARLSADEIEDFDDELKKK